MLMRASAQFLQERRVERGESRPHCRHSAQRSAQLCEVARPRGAQCYPRQDALDIAHTLEMAAHGVEAARLDQGAEGVVPGAQQRVRSQRAVEPAAQLP